jgi:hypothetical protein
MTPIQWVAEQIADIITGGALTRARYANATWQDLWQQQCVFTDEWRTKAGNTAAQRDEAIARAEVAENKLAAVGPVLDALLQRILTARNITEARKIAKQALGEAE